MFEGDTIITASNVTIDDAECYIDSGTTYITNTIAIKIDGVESILPSATLGVGGFLSVVVPSGFFIKATSTVQLYAVCETDPDSTSNTLTAKAVDFQVSNTPITVCNPSVVLNSSIKEYIRFFFADTAGTFFNGKLNGTNLVLSDYSYQVGDTGNIAVTTGNFSRPTTHGSAGVLISNTSFTQPQILQITPASTNYFTARLGYLELIFAGTALSYNNYMVGSEYNIALTTYTSSDVFQLETTATQYIVRKNGSVILVKVKNITYAVTGGTVIPSSSQISVPVTWNLPTSAGNYTFTATIGDGLRFQKVVAVHSCATVNHDNYTGTYNTPYSGNVSSNDIQCTGENNYFEQFGSITGGTLVFNVNGTFTFTPTGAFNSIASFTYRLRCGSTLETSEIIGTGTVSINYYNICNGAVANWVLSGATRCGANCTEEKEEIDLSAQCTGNQPRWVANAGGGACNRIPNLVATGLTRCQSCINEKEMQDVNTCSATYLTKSWVLNPSGNNCDSAPNWVDNGQLRCNNCTEEKQQRDNKTCSPTYNQTRWVANIGGTQCNKTPQWVDLNEAICISCQEFRKEKDNNPCSPSYNLVRNILDPEGTTCNTDAVWVETGVTRCVNAIHQKEQSSINSCSTENIRWVDTGLQLCGCVKIVKFKNLCSPDNPITGVIVTKQGVVEGNRVIEIDEGNSVFTFQAESGTFTYVGDVTYQDGVNHKVIVKDYKCQPLI